MQLVKECRVPEEHIEENLQHLSTYIGKEKKYLKLVI